jgi:hypothetical protein
MLDRAGLRWLLGGGALAGIGGIVLSETVWRPADEVLYSAAVSMEHCFVAAGREMCAFQYRLSVGNTGTRMQDSVRIEWPAALPRATIVTKVSDILASAKSTVQPVIHQETGSGTGVGTTVFTIGNLASNTVVDIDLVCSPCDGSDVKAFRVLRPRVDARGSVRQADPRVSTLQQGGMNLLRVVGLFR